MLDVGLKGLAPAGETSTLNRSPPSTRLPRAAPDTAWPKSSTLFGDPGGDEKVSDAIVD